MNRSLTCQQLLASHESRGNDLDLGFAVFLFSVLPEILTRLFSVTLVFLQKRIAPKQLLPHLDLCLVLTIDQRITDWLRQRDSPAEIYLKLQT